MASGQKKFASRSPVDFSGLDARKTLWSCERYTHELLEKSERFHLLRPIKWRLSSRETIRQFLAGSWKARRARAQPSLCGALRTLPAALRANLSAKGGYAKAAKLAGKRWSQGADET